MLGGFAVLALILLAGFCACLWWRVGISLPQTSGTVAIAGLQAPVTVTRDAAGIPTIRGANRHDTYLALGYVHAQDRLFQMDLQRRVGQGRLAEVFGAGALPTDRMMRTYGLYAHATASLGVVTPDFRAVLDAYTEGVNAWLKEDHPLPIEFALLGYRPEPWQPQDSLVQSKLMDLELAGNMRDELLRARLLQILTPEEVAILFPDYPKDGPVALGKLAALYRDLPFGTLLADLPEATGPTFASNNWVVDGAHSVTGKPLLANDPHLDFSIPGIWYLARLEAPDLDVVGGTFAGTPVVILGHNQRIAWGFTTTNGDVEDVFIEKPDPSDPTRYLIPGGTAAFETRVETIAVKNGPPETLTVRSTRHGPVISDTIKSATKVVPEGQVLALEASFLNDDDTSAEALWRVNLARSWAGFVDALVGFLAPEQNMVFADVDGDIGFYAPARLPIRKAGDGRLPVPGWTGEYDWTGWVPFNDLPHAFNPTSGHVVTANNKIVADDYPYLVTKDWDVPFRAERIEAGLAAEPRQSIEGSTRIQGDLVSLSARKLLPLLLAVPPVGEAQRRAHDLLRPWDGTMAADRPEPLLFSAWARALTKRLLAPRLGELFSAFWRLNPLITESILTEHRDWCARIPAGDCDAAVRLALQDALDELDQRWGGTMGSWRWGNAHPAFFGHPLFDRIPGLAAVFDRGIGVGGGNDTVNAAAMRFADTDHPYRDIHGPALRAIYDLADLERSVFLITPGESGIAASPHYADLIGPWHDFQWLHLPSNPSGAVLHLEPAAP